jgi:hypothetical protein
MQLLPARNIKRKKRYAAAASKFHAVVTRAASNQQLQGVKLQGDKLQIISRLVALNTTWKFSTPNKKK